jgi:hypothetical protein
MSILSGLGYSLTTLSLFIEESKVFFSMAVIHCLLYATIDLSVKHLRNKMRKSKLEGTIAKGRKPA